MSFCFLVVDDDVAFLGIIKKMLVDQIELPESPELMEARDGPEALAIFENNAGYIDLILSDLNMPTMTGIELLCNVRQREPKLPFILMSSQPDKASIVAARDAGVTGVIAKPFSPAELRAKLEAAIASTGVIASRKAPAARAGGRGD